MKKIVGMLVLVILVSTTSFAQKQHQKRTANKANFTAEQQAELMTKRLTLALDLTKAQASEVYDLALEKAQEQKEFRADRAKNRDLSDDERFKRKSKRLDKQIAHKKEMKRILNDEQYEKWEKMRYKKRKNIQQKLKNKRF